MTGGRYFGFVNGGMVPAALAANWLAAAWNQNAALRVMSPIAAELEEIVLRWICEALVLAPECAGGLVTCATMANFTALDYFFQDRKSTRLNSSHLGISYAVFCLKKNKVSYV